MSAQVLSQNRLSLALETALSMFSQPCSTIAYIRDIREDLHQKMFSFGHCPYYPSFGQLVPLFRTSKTTFCAYDRNNTNDDNDGCNNNYDGNFDDNDDKNYQQISGNDRKNFFMGGLL